LEPEFTNLKDDSRHKKITPYTHEINGTSNNEDMCAYRGIFSYGSTILHKSVLPRTEVIR
jgi:hypothetical protein